MDLFCIKWMDSVVPGSQIVAIGTRDVPQLTSGKTYTALHGKEDGIFDSRPYVTVIGDNGKPFSCHLSRFKFDSSR